MPTLPQDASDPSARAASLATQRTVYRYDHSWPPGVATAAEVPRSDSYSLTYIAHLLPISWAIFRNLLALGDDLVDHRALRDLLEGERARVPGLDPREIGQWFHQLPKQLDAFIASVVPTDPAEYTQLYQTIPREPICDRWADDEVFAWQRLAGPNPMSLTRCTAFRKGITIGPDDWQRAGQRGSLTDAMAAGQLFVCDYGQLEGAATGSFHGRAKFLRGPYALFVARGGPLMPVAIQVGDRVTVPGDPEWALAKAAVQVADANLHETVMHLGRTHMVMEAATLAMHRQLSTEHPLFVLLAPHTEYTLPINRSAATNLIAPGGVIDQVFAGTIETSASLVRSGMDAAPLLAMAPPDDLARRGLDDREVLPVHPYRDDGLPLWQALRDFVAAYVTVYYRDDAAVAADPELKAFAEELGSPDLGRIRGVTVPTTRDGLVALVAQLIWTATAQHSAVNFPQFPFMGLGTNMAGSLWGAWPRAEGPAELVDVTPPLNAAVMQFNTVYQLSNLRVNRLGRYGMMHFLDLGARRAVAAFESDLERIEADMVQRDGDRLMSYPWLRPSTVPNSIHI